jgi:hypothetical protein
VLLQEAVETGLVSGRQGQELEPGEVPRGLPGGLPSLEGGLGDADLGREGLALDRDLEVEDGATVEGRLAQGEAPGVAQLDDRDIAPRSPDEGGVDADRETRGSTARLVPRLGHVVISARNYNPAGKSE